MFTEISMSVLQNLGHYQISPKKCNLFNIPLLRKVSSKKNGGVAKPDVFATLPFQLKINQLVRLCMVKNPLLKTYV